MEDAKSPLHLKIFVGFFFLGVSNVCLPINKKKKFQTGSVRGIHNVMPLYVALDLYGDGSMMDCVIICVLRLVSLIMAYWHTSKSIA